MEHEATSPGEYEAVPPSAEGGTSCAAARGAARVRPLPRTHVAPYRATGATMDVGAERYTAGPLGLCPHAPPLPARYTTGPLGLCPHAPPLPARYTTGPLGLCPHAPPLPARYTSSRPPRAAAPLPGDPAGPAQPSAPPASSATSSRTSGGASTAASISGSASAPAPAATTSRLFPRRRALPPPPASARVSRGAARGPRAWGWWGGHVDCSDRCTAPSDSSSPGSAAYLPRLAKRPPPAPRSSRFARARASACAQPRLLRPTRSSQYKAARDCCPCTKPNARTDSADLPRGRGAARQAARPTSRAGGAVGTPSETCPFSTEGGTRRVRLVRKEGRDVSS
jgi:hypothetical protein